MQRLQRTSLFDSKTPPIQGGPDRPLTKRPALDRYERTQRNWRRSGRTAMGLGILALAFTPVIGIAPAAVLIACGNYALLKGDAKPLT